MPIKVRSALNDRVSRDAASIAGSREFRRRLVGERTGSTNLGPTAVRRAGRSCAAPPYPQNLLIKLWGLLSNDTKLTGKLT